MYSDHTKCVQCLHKSRLFLLSSISVPLSEIGGALHHYDRCACFVYVCLRRLLQRRGTLARLLVR